MRFTWSIEMVNLSIKSNVSKFLLQCQIANFVRSQKVPINCKGIKIASTSILLPILIKKMRSTIFGVGKWKFLIRFQSVFVLYI